MRSVDLQKRGFVYWQEVNRRSEKTLLKRLSNRPGVYIIRRNTEYARRLGASDIVYVGSATNLNGLNGRIRQYFHPGPTQRTNKRLLALIGDSESYEMCWKETLSIGEARQLEQDLLDLYSSDHNELPPENYKR